MTTRRTRRRTTVRPVGPPPHTGPRGRTPDVDVLVVGAGPAGLALAADLGRFDVTCRVVERRERPEPGARCPNLWRRTLWTLATAGVDVARLSSTATVMRRKVFHIGARHADVSLVDDTDPRFPAPWLVGQDVLERELTRVATAHGYRVDRGTTATVLGQDEHGVTVELARGGAVETVRAAWVVAADGEDGTCRGRVGIDARTTRYDDVDWVQADLVAGGLRHGPDAEELFHGPHRQIGLVPLGGDRYRAFLARRSPVDEPDPERAIRAALREVPATPVDVRDVTHVWTRVPTSGAAQRWREGRVLLLGESARTFAMPVHGLNTGIQDAGNLSWKLAAVVTGGTSPALLDTYEAERRPVADALRAKAELVLRAGVGADPAATLGPIMDGSGPRLRTEPEAVYTGALVGAGERAGHWVATAGLRPPNPPTVGETVRARGWLMVRRPADGAVPACDASASAGPPAAPPLDAPSGAGMCVRPDGFVLAEYGSAAARQECRTLLHDIHRHGAGRETTDLHPTATSGSAI